MIMIPTRIATPKSSTKGTAISTTKVGDIQAWAFALGELDSDDMLESDVESESDGCDGGLGCAGGVGRVGDPGCDEELLVLVERMEQSYIVVEMEMTGAARVVELRTPLVPTG